MSLRKINEQELDLVLLEKIHPKVVKNKAMFLFTDHNLLYGEKGRYALCIKSSFLDVDTQICASSKIQDELLSSEQIVSVVTRLKEKLPTIKITCDFHHEIQNLLNLATPLNSPSPTKKHKL